VTPRIVFRPEAESDTLDARAWYEERRRGLGEEFGIAVNQTVANILEHPFAYPRVRGETRRAIMRRFPYAIYFRALPEEIVVLAVTHGRRDARRWQVRR
jgi:plasmid stabilization system protein ParE